MSSNKAIRCDYIDVTGQLESAGIWIMGVVLHPSDSAVGVAVFADATAITGTFERVGTVATVTTDTPHRLEATDMIYMDWTLTDGLQRVVTIVSPTVFTITVADSGDTVDDVSFRHAQLIFDMPGILDTVQITVPGEGVPSDGLYVYLPTGASTSVFYRKAQ